MTRLPVPSGATATNTCALAGPPQAKEHHPLTEAELRVVQTTPGTGGVLELGVTERVDVVLGDVDGVVLGVVLGVGDSEDVVDGVGESDSVVDGVGESEEVEVVLGVALSDEVVDGVIEGVGVELSEGVVEGVELSEGVVEGVELSEGVLEALGVTVLEREGAAVAVAAAATSCGTKSCHAGALL